VRSFAKIAPVCDVTRIRQTPAWSDPKVLSLTCTMNAQSQLAVSQDPVTGMHPPYPAAQAPVTSIAEIAAGPPGTLTKISTAPGLQGVVEHAAKRSKLNGHHLRKVMIDRLTGIAAGTRPLPISSLSLGASVRRHDACL
jgi:hypothetical protein